MSKRLGFVSTRFAGTDGVSLESAKWAEVFWHHKHVSYWYAGKLDRDAEVSMLVPEAYFGDPQNIWINERIYRTTTRTPEVTRRIFEMADHLKATLYNFISKFEIDVLVVENALCIPMHVPLGVALTHLIVETGIPTIGHHHDFSWERTRFAINAIPDILDMAFPPTSPTLQHVTINSYAQEQLALRKGDASILIPNVWDFDSPPPIADQYSSEMRKDLNLEPDDIVFLQPTRVVPRKGIEHAIGLVAQLRNPKCKLIVSHESGDEGDDYLNALTELAEKEGVDLRFVHARVGESRTTDATGQRRYTLADMYRESDFITYPSLYEGFGNAFLEAIYFRKPVLVNRYAIFIADIEPKGFRTVTMDGFLTRDVLNQVQRIISDEKYREEMVNYNFELGRKFFSYAVLRRQLRALMINITGLDEL